MTRSLYTAASGINSHNQWLNVISNNIANTNTIAFKSSDMQFKTVFSDTLTGGTRPDTLTGGTNPRQVGNGVQIGEIRRNHNVGGSIFTGINTDLTIQGNGFFTVERQFIDGSTPGFLLTRAGNFNRDSAGFLTNVDGNRVLGTRPVDGNDETTVTPILIPDEVRIFKEIDPVTSQVVQMWLGAPGSNTITAANMGNPANTFQQADAELQSFSIGVDGSVNMTLETGDRISVRTDPTNTNQREMFAFALEGQNFAPSNTSVDGLLTIADSIFAPEQLQLRTVNVTNPQGLLDQGNNNWTLGPNAGDTSFGVPNSGSRGGLQAGALESSNVDLATEFTKLILAQRGVEANSTTVRTSSEIIQTVINMTR
ncbi:MAG: flagellar hook-basal body complex protein [Cyanobacteria bacterium HKST-UBA05]|nr:flagellar hook-basal body complex protein [Cyanobacteria bacterium HKST-UBA05]